MHAAMDKLTLPSLAAKLTYSQLCLGFAPLPRRKKVGGACTCLFTPSKYASLALRHPKFSNEAISLLHVNMVSG